MADGSSSTISNSLLISCRRHRANRNVRKNLTERLVVRPLDLQDFGNRLEQELGFQLRQLGGQRLPVVGEADDVAHDLVGGVLAEALHQPRVLAADPVGRPGEVEGNDGDTIGREARAELHRFPGAHDPVAAGDHHGPAVVRRAEDLVDQIGCVGGEPCALEDPSPTSRGSAAGASSWW
jgi:hypothetical protein